MLLEKDLPTVCQPCQKRDHTPPTQKHLAPIMTLTSLPRRMHHITLVDLAPNNLQRGVEVNYRLRPVGSERISATSAVTLARTKLPRRSRSYKPKQPTTTSEQCGGTTLVAVLHSPSPMHLSESRMTRRSRHGVRRWPFASWCLCSVPYSWESSGSSPCCSVRNVPCTRWMPCRSVPMRTGLWSKGRCMM